MGVMSPEQLVAAHNRQELDTLGEIAAITARGGIGAAESAVGQSERSTCASKTAVTGRRRLGATASVSAQ